MDARLKALLWIVAIVALVLLVSRIGEPTREVLLSFDVEPVDSPESIDFVTSTLDQYHANATFFVTGDYAEQHPNVVRNLAAKYEVACHTMTHPHLPEINDSALEWELTACKALLENLTNASVLGFRAPYNLIDERTFLLLKRLNYTYDASVFENLGWFYPRPNMTEIATSSLWLIPLEDYPLVDVAHLGDFGYFLMRQDRDEREAFDLHPNIVYAHRGAFQYLVSSYADDDVAFLTYGQASGE